MADFRVKDDFLDHPKTKKLARILGEGSILCLLRLWGHATRNKWTGEFTNMDTDDIEIAAGWNGQPGEFLNAILNVGFLEQPGEWFQLHDWEDHNGFAAKAGERKGKAKKASAKRWIDKEENAQMQIEQCPFSFSRRREEPRLLRVFCPERC